MSDALTEAVRDLVATEVQDCIEGDGRPIAELKDSIEELGSRLESNSRILNRRLAALEDPAIAARMDRLHRSVSDLNTNVDRLNRRVLDAPAAKAVGSGDRFQVSRTVEYLKDIPLTSQAKKLAEELTLWRQFSTQKSYRLRFSIEEVE